MDEKSVSRSKLDADVQNALYQGLIGLYERIEREHFPGFGHGHHACQKIVAQLSPDVLRDIIDRLPKGTVTNDITAEIESLAPVKIDRWLTSADIEGHGSLWRWWSGEWGSGLVTSEIVTAYIEDGKVRMCRRGKFGYKVDMFGIGDYFTPIKGDK